MKKLLLTLIFLVSCVLLLACGEEKQPVQAKQELPAPKKMDKDFNKKFFQSKILNGKAMENAKKMPDNSF